MNYKGLASGGARGGTPVARIVVYKTCWDSGCYDVDLLAAFDDAIRDGVHILSLSLGAQSPKGDYFNDAISIGSFHAANHKVLVVSSAGSEGIPGSTTNLAPRTLTIAASSTDRGFTCDIMLGNGAELTGESLSLFEMNASSRITSASQAFVGYFTLYQSSFVLVAVLVAMPLSPGRYFVPRVPKETFLFERKALAPFRFTRCPLVFPTLLFSYEWLDSWPLIRITSTLFFASPDGHTVKLGWGFSPPSIWARKRVCEEIIKMLNRQTARDSSSQFVVPNFEKDDAHVDLIEDMSSCGENDCDDDAYEISYGIDFTTQSV
ncbi:hypothetical protein KIW84_020909 [Lathyrus oleraceus]|uniref:Peptidase S8/S53 domain-containing protein n=1 Tax=Pisum sativum TaxID=3888 RepID=A0A9D5B397_PEA|nr:hypothetical protein KIW84_020909 [Pisum sativum]